VADRPYVLLSCAVSLDGYLDDAGDRRLLLSSPADFDEVDALRASCDAILVGAGTIRRDDPGLRSRSGPSPLRVAVTSGALPPAARFFADGNHVVFTGSPVDLRAMLADLAGRGVGRLMVEGGGSVLAQFLALGLADELRLAVAPLFVGDPRAPRFAGAPSAPRAATLAGVRDVGGTAVLTYRFGDPDPTDR
jgi:5-amino-6-(5-phosphoribosylamino)uracil reductase